jgi:hypothetical protein
MAADIFYRLSGSRKQTGFLRAALSRVRDDGSGIASRVPQGLSLILDGFPALTCWANYVPPCGLAELVVTVLESELLSARANLPKKNRL